jgi:hypothetical protein
MAKRTEWTIVREYEPDMDSIVKALLIVLGYRPEAPVQAPPPEPAPVPSPGMRRKRGRRQQE